MLLISLDRPISTSGALEQSDSSHVFTSIVHDFVCSRIDYCNSLLVGLPKVRLSLIQSVLNAAAGWLADFLVRPTSLPSCLTIFTGYHPLLGYNSRSSH